MASAVAQVATKIKETKSCQEKGDVCFKASKFAEARSWYEQGLRNVGLAKGRTPAVNKQFAAERSRLTAELSTAIAECSLLCTPPDQLRALKAATQVLDENPGFEKALLVRAQAFALPGSWQSRTRFDADKDKLIYLYPESESAAAARALTPPPHGSDTSFGQLPPTSGVSVSRFEDRPAEGEEEEDPADVEARKRQVQLRERLAQSLSGNLAWHEQYLQGTAPPAAAIAVPAGSKTAKNGGGATAAAAVAAAEAAAAARPVDCATKVRQQKARCMARISQLADAAGAWISNIVAGAAPGGARRR